MSELADRPLADGDLVTRRGGSVVLVAAGSWLEAVDGMASSAERVLGLEGFHSEGAELRAGVDFIADFGDPDAARSHAIARRILSAWLDEPDRPDWVEFVTDQA